MLRTLLLLASFLAFSATADLVHLKDGRTLSGVVKKTPDGWTITDAAGKVTHVGSGDVRGISATPAPSTVAVDDRLASLRRSVEYIGDPRQAIERYQRFIESNAGLPSATEAIRDLATWRDRLDRGLVRIGNRWVTPDERAKLQEQTLAAADEIRALLRNGRLQQADAALKPALAADPQNPALLYLRGLLLFRQDNMPAARKPFEAVVKQLPAHAPTLNNLAIIAMRQNQLPAALNYYQQALTAAPAERQVLDNIAEALNALPPDALATPAGAKLSADFKSADDALAKKLEDQNLHRWGATWLDDQQYEKAQSANKATGEKLDAFATDFETVRKRIEAIDRDLDANDRAMRRLESQSYFIGPNGLGYRMPLPGQYYDLERDSATLRSEREQQRTKLTTLRQQADELQKQLPIPKYSGVQRLIDVEGTPIDVAGAITPATIPAASTTQP